MATSPIDPVGNVEQAVRAHLTGRYDEARNALASISTDALWHEFDETRSRNTEKSTPIVSTPRDERSSRSVPLKVQMAIFRQDHFTCRYCGKRTLFTPVLRLLSVAYPDVLPYHDAWKRGVGHPIYYTHSISCEHVDPHARGGSSQADNLLTTCYLCNMRKSHKRVGEAGLELRNDHMFSLWDGLSGSCAGMYSSVLTRGYDVERDSPLSQEYWQRAVNNAKIWLSALRTT